jgi:hypothetical protein
MTIVGRPAAVRCAFQQLCGAGPHSLRKVGLKVRTDKSDVFGGNPEQCSELAASLGVLHRHDGMTVVGVPFGTDACAASLPLGCWGSAHRGLWRWSTGVAACLKTKLCPCRPSFCSCSSLTVRMVPLQRTVAWRHLVPSTRGVETAVLSAAQELFRLPGGDGPWGYSPVLGRELYQLLVVASDLLIAPCYGRSLVIYILEKKSPSRL